MNNIIKPNGEYLRMEFKSKNGTFTLQGTENTGREILDTFRNEQTREFIVKNRKTVFQQAELGNIW